MAWPTEFTTDVQQALLAPFPDDVIECRENKFFYVDARAVQNRLDEVVGPINWSFDFEVPHYETMGVAVKGCLTIFGVSKCDAGEHWRVSERDKIETLKAAVSDALKRCAVHFGVGRYLYELEVARAGKMTPAEKDAAARKAGYVGGPAYGAEPTNGPSVTAKHWPNCKTCEVPMTNEDMQIWRPHSKLLKDVAFCQKHINLAVKAVERAAAGEPQVAEVIEPYTCSICGDPVMDKPAQVALAQFGAVACRKHVAEIAAMAQARVPAGTIG